MPKDFEQTLERQDGGNPVALKVTGDSVTLTIPPPVTQNEQDAVTGLAELAKALKKDLGTVPAGNDEKSSSISINTSERDPALGIVVAQILEANGIVKAGEAKKFETAIDAADHAPAQQVAKQHSPLEQLNAIRAAMSGVVKEAHMPETIVASVAVAQVEKVPNGIGGRA